MDRAPEFTLRLWHRGFLKYLIRRLQVRALPSLTNLKLQHHAFFRQVNN